RHCFLPIPSGPRASCALTCSPLHRRAVRKNDAIFRLNHARNLMTGTRDGAIERAEKYFDDGGFLADLRRRVAIPTTSQEADSMPALQEYVSGEMTQSLQKLGYACTVLPNPRTEYGPFLIARRVEDAAKPTVLTYGHGDVIRGQDEQWRS